MTRRLTRRFTAFWALLPFFAFAQNAPQTPQNPSQTTPSDQTSATEQDWVDAMFDHSVNFYDVQAKFNAYWQNREYEKGKGWKQFKRWEHFMEPRVYPTGERPDPSILYHEALAAQTEANSSPNFGNWQTIGPFNGNQMGGIGRINAIAFHPQHPDTIYAGSPSGGFWISYNGGNSWITTSDQLTNLGVSVIVVDPNNPNIIYIATGDRDASDTYSYGIMKSTDGGLSWLPTGYTAQVSSAHRVRALIINPQNSNQLVAATSSGIFRTTNAGNTWTQVQTGNFSHLVHKPGDFSTQYAVTIGQSNVNFYRSTNSGTSFSFVTSGLPSSGVRRAEIGVTPDDPNYVYIVYGANNNGFYGLYRSTNSGQSFTQRSNSPNLLGWNTTGSDNGGQAWYDLAIAVSPTNRNVVFVGGVNIWHSTNGGTSWTLSAHWFGGGGRPYVHADHHCFAWQPKTHYLYNGNDGGVSLTTNNGTSYQHRNNGLNITQYYKIGITEAHPERTIAGAQDNGTHRLSTSWDRVYGGDGMDCAIDQANPNIMYASIYYGQFFKSVNNGQSFNANFNLPPAGTGNWVTPFAIDPNNNNVLYAGFTRLWKSTNAGVSFTAISPNINNQNMDAIAIAPSNSNIIYIGIQSNIYRSNDGGATFTNISNGTGTQFIRDIEVHPTDPLRVYISLSGYSASQKVLFSENGGSSWSNITDNLPNLPANALAFEEGSPNGIYVGTDVGVYYRDDNTGTWVPFMKNLPNVIVRDLHIHKGEKKIVAGTYGRGIYESPLFSAAELPPVPHFAFEPGSVCNLSDTVVFSDKSSYYPESYEWFFYPSAPTFVNGTSDTSQNPQVVFTTSGVYSVRLRVKNAYGTGDTIMVNTLNVGGTQTPMSEDFEGATFAWNATTPSQYGWQPITLGSNTAMWVDHFGNNSVGDRDTLLSTAVNTQGATEAYLVYDYAYKRYSANNSDSLYIRISTDCGQTWATLKAYGEDGTGSYATGTGVNAQSAWTPSSPSDWCLACDTIPLNGYLNQNSVLLMFEAVNDWGNNLYLDNILVYTDNNPAPAASMAVLDEVCSGNTVSFYNLSTGNATSQTWHFPGGVPPTSTDTNPTVSYANPGTYDVSLVVANANGTDSLFLQNEITILPSVTPTITLNLSSTTICAGDAITATATGTNGGSNPRYLWFLNGQPYGGFDSLQVFVGLQNQDAIQVKYVSSEECVTADTVMAPSQNIVVNALPNVSLPAFSNEVCVTDAPITLSGGTPAGGQYKGPGVNNGQFDPTAAGVGPKTIWYVFENATGCKDSASHTVLVRAPHVVLLNAGNYCISNSAFTLNAGFPFGGTYYYNGNPITTFDPSAVGQGSYYITYIHDNGTCEVEVGDTLKVYGFPPKPTVTVSWGALTCDQAGYSYQWFDENGTAIPGETNQVFYPQSVGRYSVKISNDGGCSETSALYYIDRIEVAELAREIGFLMFPNPAKENVTLAVTTEKTEVYNLMVYSASGQILLRNHIELGGGKNGILEVSNWANGLYFLRLERENRQFVVELKVLR